MADNKGRSTLTHLKPARKSPLLDEGKFLDVNFILCRSKASDLLQKTNCVG